MSIEDQAHSVGLFFKSRYIDGDASCSNFRDLKNIFKEKMKLFKSSRERKLLYYKTLREIREAIFLTRINMTCDTSFYESGIFNHNIIFNRLKKELSKTVNSPV